MSAKAPSIPKYNPPTPPAYQPLDISGVNIAATAADQGAYNLSDYEFRVQNPELDAAQKQFQKQIYGDIANPQLPAAVQNQMMTAGLTQAANSMGATGAFGGGGSNTNPSTALSTAPGVAPGQTAQAQNELRTAGESAVARNFGLNVANYLQQQKQVGEQELALGTSMFPRREFGIGGPGIAQGMITENTNKNNYNWGVYGAQVQAAQFQENLAAQQAGLQAGASNANSGSMMGLAGAGIGAIGSIAGALAI